MGDVVIECLGKDHVDAHFKLIWLKAVLKRKQNGKIEEPVMPRTSRNLHNCMYLNKKNQLDGAERAGDI